jgi:uncharacterized membrane protein
MTGGFTSSPAKGQDSAPEPVQQERKALDEEGRMVDFERDVAPIFVKYCYECHNEEDAKNDFRIDDPEYALSYIEPEDAESSTLFVDYMLSDDPDYLMPPPSHGGPLSPAELSIVRVWIDEGANWPEGLMLVAEGAEAAETKPAAPERDPAERPLAERIWAFQGFFHPATVHFPIALFLLGAVFVVLGWKWPSVGTQIPAACLIVGALTSVASTAMGWSFAVEQGYGSWSKVDFDSEAFWHRWSGVIVTALSVVFAIVALMALRRESPKLNRFWKSGLLVVALLVGLVGHQGGELSYGKDFYPKAFRILLGTPKEQAENDDATEADEPATDTVAATAINSGLDVQQN